MAAAAEEAWGERVAEGLVVVKDGNLVPTRRIRLVEAGHPVPDQRGAQAARDILALVKRAAADDLVLVLVSGGASALTPAPAAPITLADKQAVTRLLLAAGADINQLNAVRKHCSVFKGGQLARAAAPARVSALLLSDVIGDPLDVIGSGPTAPDASTFREALAILTRFELTSARPPSVRERLERGAAGEVSETPKPDDPIFDRVTNVVIGNNQLVVDAAAARAAALGLAPHVLTRSLHGEARDVARDLVALGREIAARPRPVAAPACVIAGGETTVTVRGRGHGRALPGIRPRRGPRARGPDPKCSCSPPARTAPTAPPTPRAPSRTADTARRARHQHLDPRIHLDTNNSNPVFAKLGDLVVTAPRTRISTTSTWS